MAAIAVTDMTQAQKEELLCTYATLILHDEKMEISAGNISKLIKASGGTVEPYLPGLFARALGNKNVGDLISAVGTVSASAPVGAPAATPAAGAAAAASVEEQKKEEEPEEEDDMGFSLFD